MGKTFNEYLGTVDRFRRKGVPRSDAHWQAMSLLRQNLADQVSGTRNDPRGMEHGEIDSWLGWLVVEWNRVP